MNPDVIAVHLGMRAALLDDDRVIPITDLIDIYGDLTDDPDEAVGAVAKLDDKAWVAIDLRGYTVEPN